MKVVIALVQAILMGAALWPAAVPAAAGQARAGERLTVFAASDLVFALGELAREFERDRETRVTLVFGSSGNLSLQIEHGAPADVFFSASEAFLDRLGARDLIVPETRVVYARGSIVLATHADGAAAASLDALLGPDFRRVAIANPAHAPYGQAAERALRAAGVWDGLRPKLVYGDSVRHALQFLESGAVEAAIVARSIAGVSGIRWVPIDRSRSAPLVQPAAVIRSSRRPDLARAFLDLVTGPAGREVLARYGFESPPAGER